MTSCDLIEAALKALQQECYEDAITAFEQICQTTAADSREYWQAQMHLVEVYAQVGQPNRAIDLCQSLLTASNAQVQLWAQAMLKRLTDQASIDIESNLSTNPRTENTQPETKKQSDERLPSIRTLLTGLIRRPD